MPSDARAARRERQHRLSRLLLVGAAGSLTLFLGMIVVQDAASADPPVSMAVEQLQPDDSPENRVPRPRVRTRTS